MSRSTSGREKSASSTRSYYKNYEQKRIQQMNDSIDKEAAAAARLRSAARLNSAYRLSDPLTADAIYNPDYALLKPSPSTWGTRWTLSHEELLRQLNEERSRIKELELVRNSQTTTIGQLESEIRRMRINGYDDASDVMEENARLRRDLTRLEDEVVQLRSGRNLTHSLEFSSRLDAAESRVRVLEQQLLDDARQWDAERSRLLSDLAQAGRRWVPPYSNVLPPVGYPAPRYVVYRD